MHDRNSWSDSVWRNSREIKRNEKSEFYEGLIMCAETCNGPKADSTIQNLGEPERESVDPKYLPVFILFDNFFKSRVLHFLNVSRFCSWQNFWWISSMTIANYIAFLLQGHFLCQDFPIHQTPT